MLAESAADALTAPDLQEIFQISKQRCLAGQGQVEFHLRCSRSTTAQEAQVEVDRLAGELEDVLGDSVFSAQGESLEEIVGYYLQMRNVKLAVAESCTGGMVAERITSVPGSSRHFLGGAVVYSNDLKTLFADVPPLMIEAHGAVSREVAVALAENIRDICNADIGVGITGIAGPAGGTEEKPVGLGVRGGHRWSEGGSRAATVSRRPRAHPAMGEPTGPGYGPALVDVTYGLKAREIGPVPCSFRVVLMNDPPRGGASGVPDDPRVRQPKANF